MAHGNNRYEAAEYFYAVHRKVEIATYHLDRLKVGLAATNIEITIPVQAHFEGVLSCAVSVSDQLAEGIRVADQLPDPPRRAPGTLLQKVLGQLAEQERTSAAFVQPVLDWTAAPILRDAREVRRRVIHHFYEKTRYGLKVVVESVGPTGYEGDRGLSEYSTALVDHLSELKPLLVLIETEYGG